MVTDSGPPSKKREIAWPKEPYEQKALLKKVNSSLSESDISILAGQLILEGTTETGLLRSTQSFGSVLVKDIAKRVDFPTTSDKLQEFYKRAAELQKTWARAQYNVLGPMDKDGKRIPPTGEAKERAQREKAAIMNSEEMKSFRKDFFENVNQEIINMLLPSFLKFMDKKDPQTGLREFMNQIGFAIVSGRVGELGKGGEGVLRELALYEKGRRVDGKGKGEPGNSAEFGLGVNHTFMYGEILSTSPLAQALVLAAKNVALPTADIIDGVMDKASVIVKDTKAEILKEKILEAAKNGKIDVIQLLIKQADDSKKLLASALKEATPFQRLNLENMSLSREEILAKFRPLLKEAIRNVNSKTEYAIGLQFRQALNELNTNQKIQSFGDLSVEMRETLTQVEERIKLSQKTDPNAKKRAALHDETEMPPPSTPAPLPPKQRVQRRDVPLPQPPEKPAPKSPLTISQPTTQAPKPPLRSRTQRHGGIFEPVIHPDRKDPVTWAAPNSSNPLDLQKRERRGAFSERSRKPDMRNPNQENPPTVPNLSTDTKRHKF